jgi:uncharacterized protein YbjQ (UPF0145 family)
MRWPILVVVLCLPAGCAGVESPEPRFPPAPSESASSDGDEAAQERALVNDPSVIAAAQHVRVIQNDQLGCPSEVLGLVDIHEPVATVDRALEVLKRKAAKLGAEAVIGVEFHHGEPGEEPTHLSGMAVRCNDLIKGRTYDVLGRIEVPGKMGDEDDAERELLARAGAMGADLIIGMGFEHGEGGAQPTKVWGTAIRFR